MAWPVQLLVELGAVLIPIPALGFPLDHISCKIALKPGSINAHKLPLAGKIGLASTLLHLALLGDKMNIPRGIGKGNTSQLKNNGIALAENIIPVI